MKDHIHFLLQGTKLIDEKDVKDVSMHRRVKKKKKSNEAKPLVFVFGQYVL